MINILTRNKLVFTALMLLFATGTPVYSQNTNGLFDSTEHKSTDLSAFKKWAALRARHNDEQASQSIPIASRSTCRRTKYFKCVNDEWREIMDGLQSKSTKLKIDTINRYFNRAPYITDMVNWQQQDYWATINQFFGKNGDCEDYAIAKYYSLLELGISADKMRIVIVHDDNLNVAHAVLAVYEEGNIWILDNQISNVTTDNNIVHYIPLYSINEKAWWLHKTT